MGYSCCNCRADKNNFDKEGDPRSVATLAQSYENYKNGGSIRKKAMDHFSVVNQPLLMKTMGEMKDCDQSLIDFFSPSELHLMLGFVEKVYKRMKEKWPGEVEEWVKKSLSLRKPYHGGAFEGGSCKKLLNNINIFEDQFGNPKIPEMAPYL